MDDSMSPAPGAAQPGFHARYPASPEDGRHLRAIQRAPPQDLLAARARLQGGVSPRGSPTSLTTAPATTTSLSLRNLPDPQAPPSHAALPTLLARPSPAGSRRLLQHGLQGIGVAMSARRSLSPPASPPEGGRGAGWLGEVAAAALAGYGGDLAARAAATEAAAERDARGAEGQGPPAPREQHAPGPEELEADAIELEAAAQRAASAARAAADATAAHAAGWRAPATGFPLGGLGGLPLSDRLAADAAAVPGTAAALAANAALPVGAPALDDRAALPRRNRLGPPQRVLVEEVDQEITPAPSSGFRTAVEAGQTGGRFEGEGAMGQTQGFGWPFPGFGNGDATPRLSLSRRPGLRAPGVRVSDEGDRFQVENVVRSPLGRSCAGVGGPVAQSQLRAAGQQDMREGYGSNAEVRRSPQAVAHGQRSQQPADYQLPGDGGMSELEGEVPWYEAVPLDAFGEEPEPDPEGWSLGQVDYIARTWEERARTNARVPPRVKALPLLMRLEEIPQADDLQLVPRPTPDDPPIWKRSDLLKWVPHAAPLQNCDYTELLWVELHPHLDDRLPLLPPRSASPAPPRPAAAGGGRRPAAPPPPSAHPPAALPNPAAPPPPATPPTAAPPPGAPPPGAPPPPPPPEHGEVYSPASQSPPTAAPAAATSSTRPRGGIALLAPPDWKLPKTPTVQPWDGSPAGFMNFETGVKGFVTTALGAETSRCFLGADYKYLVKVLITQYLAAGSPIRTDYEDPKVLDDLVETHLAEYQKAGGAEALYRGQAAVSGGRTLAGVWLADVQRRTSPQAAILKEQFKKYQYPAGVDPAVAHTAFKTQFRLLDEVNYPESKRARKFVKSAMTTLVGGDFLRSQVDIIKGSGEWDTLTLQRADELLRGMVKARKSEGLKAAAAGTSGGGDKGKGSGGGTGTGTVPVHAVAPVKGGGGAKGGGGGNSGGRGGGGKRQPLPPGGGVTAEAAARADTVCPQGRWVAHQAKTCRLHPYRNSHLQQDCRVSASRINDPAGLLAGMEQAMREVKAEGKLPADLKGSLGVPVMAAATDSFTAELAHLAGKVEQLAAAQALPSSAASEMAAPVPVHVQAWQQRYGWTHAGPPSAAPPSVAAPSVAGSAAPAVFRQPPAPMSGQPTYSHAAGAAQLWPPAPAMPTQAVYDPSAAPSVALPFGAYSVVPVGAAVAERMPPGILQRANSAVAAEVSHALRPPAPKGAGDPAAVQLVPQPLDAALSLFDLALKQLQEFRDSLSSSTSQPQLFAAPTAAVSHAGTSGLLQAASPLPYLQQTCAADGLLVAGHLAREVLVDSGSAVVLIARRLAERLQLRQGPANGITVTTAKGRSQLGGSVSGGLLLTFAAGTPEAFSAWVPAFVVEDEGAEAYEVLLGMSALLPLQFELLATAGNERLRLHPPGRDALALPVAIRWPHPVELPATATTTSAHPSPPEQPPPPAGGRQPGMSAPAIAAGRRGPAAGMPPAGGTDGAAAAAEAAAGGADLLEPTDFTPDGRRTLPPEAKYVVTEGKWLLCERPEMTPELRAQYVALFNARPHLFAHSMQQLGEYRGDVGPARIELTHERAIYQRPRSHSAEEYAAMDAACQELLDAGIMEESRSSQYAMNSTMPPKRAADGTWTQRRFCQDARELNAATQPDLHLSPLPEQLFQQIGDATWLTKMDCRAAFLQIPLAPEHRERTSFWWRRRLMQYKRLVYGLRNATAHFQRVMDHAIRKYGLEQFVACYVDDLLIFSRTAEEHLDHLRRVFDMLEDIGIKLHPEKTLVGGDAVEFLGFMVSAQGLSPTRAKVEALLALEPPTSSGGVRRLLGMFSYYRGLVPHFATITAPLNALTSVKYMWTTDSWGPEQQAALDELKRIYTEMNGPVLRRVHPQRPLILHTDFSGVGISGILGQLDDDGREYLCAAVSRSLNVHERRYDSYKGELLAVVWGCRTFYPYLATRHFTVVTDHAPLLWLMSQQEGLPAQYARWALQLQAFAFDVVHRPGRLHQNADALSRHPRLSAHDGTGARVDEEGDPLRPPPVLVPYPGVSWPLYAYSRAPAGSATPPAAAAHLAFVSVCSLALAQRFAQQGVDLTDPACGLAAAPDACGPLAGLTHLAGPVPAARTAYWCVLAVCTVVSTGLPVTAASDLTLDDSLEALAAGQPAAGVLEALAAGQPAAGAIYTLAAEQPAAGASAVGGLGGPPVAGITTLQLALRLLGAEGPALRRLRIEQALPLRLREGTGEVVGVNTAMVQHDFFPAALGGSSVSVLELPGGLASGLLACLGSGFSIQRYVHLSCDAHERLAVARLVPIWALHFAGQISAGVWDQQLVPEFSTPAALMQWAGSAAAVEQLGLGDEGTWIVVGSWAGNSSFSTEQIVGFLGGLQHFRRERRLRPPAFVLEGPFFNDGPPPVAGWPLGLPSPLDAAATGAAVHRLSCVYSNLANPAHLHHCVRQLRPPDGRDLATLLPPGRAPAAASTVLAPPYAPCDVPGRPWAAIPPPSVTSTPLVAGPNRTPCQVAAADYTAAAGFWLRTSRDRSLELAVNLLEQSSPPPVFQSVLSLCMALYSAFITPNELHYPAARHVPATPQGGGETS